MNLAAKRLTETIPKTKPVGNVSFWSRLAYMLLLIPHFKPAALSYIAPELDTVFDWFRIISTILILALYISQLVHGRKISGIIIGIGLYQLTLFLSTWHNSGEYWTLFVTAGSAIAVSMLVEMMLRKDVSLCLDAMLPLLEILVYANLVTILIYPNGMYQTIYYWQNWLLGYDNLHISIILPAFMVSLLKDNYTGKKYLTLRTWFLLIAGYATIILRWSATSLVGLMVMAIFIILPGLFKVSRLFNCLNYVIVNAVFFIGIILMRLQKYFTGFITAVLGRDLTFTTRTRIWDATIEFMRKQPVLGYGFEENIVLRQKIWGDHAHNQYLWDLYRGGILHFSCFIAIIIMITVKLMKQKKDRAAQIISIVLCIMLLMWQVEAYYSMMFFAIYVFSYHVDWIIEGRDAFLGKNKAE